MRQKQPLVLRDYPDKRNNIKRLAEFYKDRRLRYAKKHGYSGSMDVLYLREAILKQHRDELNKQFPEAIVNSMMLVIDKDLPPFEEDKVLKSVCGGNVQLYSDLSAFITTDDNKKDEFLNLISQDRLPNTEWTIAAIKLIQQFNQLAPCLPFMPIKNIDESDIGIVAMVAKSLEEESRAN